MEYNDLGEMRIKLRGPMHYKIGFSCLFNASRYILCCNPFISKFSRPCLETLECLVNVHMQYHVTNVLKVFIIKYSMVLIH